MSEYNLYLDESYDREKNKYLIAGFAIDVCNEHLLQEKMNEIKQIFWSKEYIENNETVLHCTELSLIRNNRNNKQLHRYIKRECYNIFTSMDSDEIKDKIQKMHDMLAVIIRTLDITVFGCLIDEKQYNYLYPDKIMQEDIYSISIETILENYVHFLHENKSVGNVVYESLDSNKTVKADNVKIQKNFCKVIANNKGILLTKSEQINKYLRDFVFPKKNEENAGLELADFICYYLYKAQFTSLADKKEIMKQIEKKLYNGNNDITAKDVSGYFGLRVIPENVKYVKELECELKKVKKALENLKRECSNLTRKNKILIEEKRIVEEENIKMREYCKQSIDKLQ